MRLPQKIAAGVTAGLLVAGGVTWAVLDHPAGPASAAPIPTSTTAARPESACGLTGTPGAAGQVPANWQNVAGWFLPVSATDGPARRSPTGAWSCFTRTQAGAVLAGWVIPMRAEGVAEDWQTVVRTQTVPGAAQAVKLKTLPTTTGGAVTVRGFTIAGYTQDRATISYYLHTDTLEASCSTNLEWYAGDWRVLLQPDGSTASGCVQGVPAQFTPWGPPA